MFSGFAWARRIDIVLISWKHISENLMDLKLSKQISTRSTNIVIWIYSLLSILSDNQSVVTNTSDPMSKLNKKHNAIAFHRVREAVAAGWIQVAKVDTKENLADILTKSLPQDGRNHLMDQVLY